MIESDRRERAPNPSIAAGLEGRLMAEFWASGALTTGRLATRENAEMSATRLARYCARRENPPASIFDIGAAELLGFGLYLPEAHKGSAPRAIYNAAVQSLGRARRELWSGPMPILAVPAPPPRGAPTEQPESLTQAQREAHARFSLRRLLDTYDRIDAAEQYWDYADRFGPPPTGDVAAMTHLEFGAHLVHRYGGNLVGSGGLTRSESEYERAYRHHRRYFTVLRGLVLRRKDHAPRLSLLMAINALNPCSVYQLATGALRPDDNGRLWIHSVKRRIEHAGGKPAADGAHVKHLVAPEDEELVRMIFERTERATARLRARAGQYGQSVGVYVANGEVRSLKSIYETERGTFERKVRAHVMACERSEECRDVGRKLGREVKMRDSRGRWLNSDNIRYDAIRRIDSFSETRQELLDRTGHRGNCVERYLDRHEALCLDLEGLERANLAIDREIEQALSRHPPDVRPTRGGRRAERAAQRDGEPAGASRLGW
jgi:hypothetical protein